MCPKLAGTIFPIQSHQDTATALWKDLWSAGCGREGSVILPGHWVGLKKLRAVKRSWEVGSSLALPFHPCGCASHHLPLGFSSPGSPTWQACRPCIHAFTWLVAHPIPFFLQNPYTLTSRKPSWPELVSLSSRLPEFACLVVSPLWVPGEPTASSSWYSPGISVIIHCTHTAQSPDSSVVVAGTDMGPAFNTRSCHRL